MEETDATATAQSQRQHEEVAGRAGPDSRPVFCLVVFGLLLTATLVVDAPSDTSTMSGLALTFAGIMLFTGVAELLDPTARRLVAGVRYGGMAMALLGLVLQLVS